MKKISNLNLFVSIGVFLSFNLHAALTIQLDQNQDSSGVGGEFTAIPSDASLLAFYSPISKLISGGFETFCLEYNEEFVPGGTYNAVINSGTVNGGVGVGNTPGAVPGKFDPISMGTAWLYSQFAAGTLAGFNYTGSGRQTSAGLLQQAFWYLENEIPNSIGNPTFDFNNPFYVAALANCGGTNGAMANANGAYGVVAMNLTYPDGSPSQDQLAIVPEASTVIAGVLLLLPFGASTFRILYKRRIKI